jgi:hypothetical protein
MVVGGHEADSQGIGLRLQSQNKRTVAQKRTPAAPRRRPAPPPLLHSQILGRNGRFLFGIFYELKIESGLLNLVPCTVDLVNR